MIQILMEFNNETQMVTKIATDQKISPTALLGILQCGSLMLYDRLKADLAGPRIVPAPAIHGLNGHEEPGTFQDGRD